MKRSAIPASAKVVSPASPSPGTACQPTLEAHLLPSVETHWRKYRNRLKRCQKSFSEEAVHALRISLRQLIALLESIEVMEHLTALGSACSQLKKQLKLFNALRDFQVHLALLDKPSTTRPILHDFVRRLRKKEAKWIHRLAEVIPSFKTSDIKKRIAKGLRRFATNDQCQPMELQGRARKALEIAYDEVLQRRNAIEAGNPVSIHRLRVAFKKYRYMLMALHPVLPGIPRPCFEQMKKMQMAMGNIQDQYVLGLEFDAFLHQQNPRKQIALQPLRQPMERKLQRATTRFLRRVETFDSFAPRLLFAPAEP